MWQAQIVRVGYKSQYRTFDNKTTTAAWAREVEGEMDHGAFIDRSPSSATTLIDLLSDESTAAISASLPSRWRILFPTRVGMNRGLCRSC